MDIFLVLFVALFTAIAYFTNEDSIFKDRKRRVKKITRKGWFLICIHILIILSTVILHIINKNELQESEREAVSKQNSRDSILKMKYDSSLYLMKMKYDSSNLKTIFTISELLGKYGFILDSTNRRLLKVLRDSTKQTIILPYDPILQLCGSYGIEFSKTINDSLYYDITFCSYDASSIIDSVLLKGAYVDTAGKLISEARSFVSFRNIKIPVDSPITISIVFPSIVRKNFKYIYLYFQGSYTNSNKKKHFRMNDIYSLNIETNEWTEIAGDKKRNILSFITKRKN